MKDETGPYWVDVSLESEEMDEAVLTAMAECENVRMWALQAMTKLWSATQGSTKTSELVPAMTQYVRKQNIGAQRYSLLSALNSAVTEFNQVAKSSSYPSKSGGTVHVVKFPKFEANSDLELVFQARSIWRRYMAEYDRISTVYGSIFLEGDWIETVRAQADEMEASREIFPFLVYSATLRKTSSEWKLHFNAHSPTSQIGKKKARQKKVREQWE